MPARSPLLFGLTLYLSLTAHSADAQNRYATSDSMSGYVHWIDLYDADNNRIDPAAENPQAYSPEKTCGRCHDFQTISHGWHFNAIEPDSRSGRAGQPWIWSDERTGTHLPLAYREWEGTYNPDLLGLSRWQVAAKLGGYLPGGGPGSKEALAVPIDKPIDGDERREDVTGPLPVDCMICHRRQGSGYSPFVWTEQIESENFAYAPTAAMGLAEITGSMSRIKELDPDDTSRLPKVAYDASRFREDGKAFFDLVRKPPNDACYYCHTNLPVDAVAGNRWLHDEDVHLRAGLQCADCHRNGLDHRTVRGYKGEEHPAGSLVASLSCQGCHLGSNSASVVAAELPGRLGAPRPEHRGLPPLHFEKLSCTACHSGPLPESETPRQLNSIAHRLGHHVQRTGMEPPGIVAPVFLTIADTSAKNEPPDEHHVATRKYAPHRLYWPSFWGELKADGASPLNPELVYDIVRRPLKVRRDFTEELADASLSLSQRSELLGEERARVREDERTAEEQKLVAEAEAAAARVQINERMAEALAALEEELGITAVYVSGGVGFVRNGEAAIQPVAVEQLGAAAQPYAWPLAHNVRPKQQSLGATGCAECHSDQSLFFHATVRPVAVLPQQSTEATAAHTLQGVDLDRLRDWNQLFVGRSTFKIVAWIALLLTCTATVAVLAANLASLRGRSHG